MSPKETCYPSRSTLSKVLNDYATQEDFFVHWHAFYTISVSQDYVTALGHFRGGLIRGQGNFMGLFKSHIVLVSSEELNDTSSNVSNVVT